MFSARRIVTALESKGIYVSRHRNKFFPEFVDELHTQILKESRGVLHIGAHVGQESLKYAEFDIDVLWIEADPDTYKELERRIENYSVKQKAVNVLLGDKSNQKINFYRSSNNGESSSIFKFGQTKFPNVFTASTTVLTSMRLDDLFSKTDLACYDHWVVDVQGAEQQVLVGASELLSSCQSLLVEISRANYYEGGTNYEDLCGFLREYDFKPLWQPQEGFHGNLLFLRF